MKKLRRRLHKAARRSIIERDCISYATILHPPYTPRPMTPIPTTPQSHFLSNITIIHPHPPSNERLHVYAPSCKGGLDSFLITLLPRESVEQNFDELVPRSQISPSDIFTIPPKAKNTFTNRLPFLFFDVTL
jgi:hypothetical protein